MAACFKAGLREGQVGRDGQVGYILHNLYRLSVDWTTAQFGGDTPPGFALRRTSDSKSCSWVAVPEARPEGGRLMSPCLAVTVIGANLDEETYRPKISSGFLAILRGVFSSSLVVDLVDRVNHWAASFGFKNEGSSARGVYVEQRQKFMYRTLVTWGAFSSSGDMGCMQRCGQS
ncbi:MAG: hypothetical protein KME46_32885 [Brasilonema angustatum HA4187-MV1]|nr:hypothetical protein [Brasilonema angustatum HA4187-MV1]MBW4597546.1 hypothetical protein [Brasilonema angustatum HA4187-MV1]MBW4597567.1 hypothetical protein [Brasilonema angustatum HA4187-MV1]MBW4597568.1 hypothetical protein [Brasilonema angustatum HA4187-MV1]